MAGTVEALPPAELGKAVAALWRLRSPIQGNLFGHPLFVRLHDVCCNLYSLQYKPATQDSLSFAINNALSALGFTAHLSWEHRHLALSAEVAAAGLHTAFTRTKVTRSYLCPLDKADDLPKLEFGPNRIARLTAAELEKLVDLPRLRRVNPNWVFDSERFSQFKWLLIEKACLLDRPPQERAIPLLFEKGGRDWGAIQPHRQRVPAAVEDALFVMLLAPWEDWVGVDWPKGKDWVEAPTRYWRAFEVRWVHCFDDDIFARASPPPSPDTLSWDPPIVDEEGEEVFGTERPERVPIKSTGAETSEWLNDARWSEVTRAHRTSLFSETPVAHFFVKAFLEEDALDEFLAHLLTIEAALGLESDYPGVSKRTERAGGPTSSAQPPDRRAKSVGATKRMAARVSALLEGEDRGREYCDLFNIRSTFLHGRRMNDPIASETRVKARRLTREVVNALVQAALNESRPREDYLKGLHP
jgi:hypothetical protein